MTRFLSSACVLGLLVALGLLVQSSGPSDRSQAPTALFGPSVLRAAEETGDWGTVKGQVIWGGEDVPERKVIDVTKDADHCLAHGKLYSQELIVNKDGKGIQHVYVWLAPDAASGQKNLPIHPSLQTIKDKEVVLDQPTCQFVPHAIAMREGQDLVAKNSAPVSHNVHWTGGIKNPGGNILLPPGESHTIDDLKADRFPVQITCDIHPWMKAWVRVFDHPYFALTDADGKFEIKNAPAGPCRLIVWHESNGWLGGAAGKNGSAITIKAGAVTDVGKLDYKPK